MFSLVGSAYGIPNEAGTYVNVPLPVRIGAFRGNNDTHNGFLLETMIDEAAHATGADPLEYRRRLLSKDARSIAVLDRAAAIAGWGTVLGRYDLVPAFVTVLALWAARRRRFGPAYALLAVGVLLKLYPALFVPLVAMEQWRALGGVPLRTRPPRAVVAGVGLFCLLTAAGFAVAFLVNPAGWLGPFSYNAGRPIQLESVPATLLWLSGLLGFPTGPDKSFGSTNLVGQLSTPISLLADLALVAGLVWVYLRQAAGRLELTAAFAGCLLVVIATGRVLSPQYLIWVLPFLAILLRRFDPVWLAVCVLTVAEFPFGYLALHPGPPGHLAPYPGFLFVLIALRNAALVVAIVRFLIASSARAAAAAA